MGYLRLHALQQCDIQKTPHWHDSQLVGFLSQVHAVYVAIQWVALLYGRIAPLHSEKEEVTSCYFRNILLILKHGRLYRLWDVGSACFNDGVVVVGELYES